MDLWILFSFSGGMGFSRFQKTISKLAAGLSTLNKKRKVSKNSFFHWIRNKIQIFSFLRVDNPATIFENPMQLRQWKRKQSQ